MKSQKRAACGDLLARGKGLRMQSDNLQTEESQQRVQGVQRYGCSKKQENRKLRIEKIGKIGNFALKNRRKIGKSKVLLSTKIASLKSHNRTSYYGSCFPAPHKGYNKGYESSDSTFTRLDQLSRLRRSENDQ